MSILGVKKKQVDTSEIRNALRTMETLNLRVLNIESMVTTIKSKPDRKIINIYAGIDGPISKFQDFNNGGSYYAMSFPGQIISISLISVRTNREAVSVNVSNNITTILHGYGIELHRETYSYITFDTPFKVKAGDVISFSSMSDNSGCINTLVSLIIELFV